MHVIRSDRSDRAIDPSNLWQWREADRLTDIAVVGDRERVEVEDNVQSCTEVRSGARLRRPRVLQSRTCGPGVMVDGKHACDGSRPARCTGLPHLVVVVESASWACTLALAWAECRGQQGSARVCRDTRCRRRVTLVGRRVGGGGSIHRGALFHRPPIISSSSWRGQGGRSRARHGQHCALALGWPRCCSQRRSVWVVQSRTSQGASRHLIIVESQERGTGRS